MALLSFCLVAGCAGHVLQREHAAEALKTEEYDKKIVIKEEPVALPPASASDAAAAKEGATKADTAAAEPPPPVKIKTKPAPPAKKVHKAVAKKKVSSHKGAMHAKGPRQPTLEDSEGFAGRRPVVDPFRIGEKVTLNLSYFNIVAGTLSMEVKPFAEVNGEKAYHFEVRAKSNSFFNHIYAVDDKAETYLSYDELIPFNLQISLKESKQLAETRTLFDWKNLHADYWQKRITKEHGETSKKIDWKILSYSQNVISAAFYLRCFKMETGKKLAFRVADEGKNIVFRGEVLRREKLSTDAGDFMTWVIKPEVTVDGVFTPVGEVLMWLTDDDRKFVVRMESKIKIGTIVAKLKSIEKGLD
jgi:hypothetical protein